MKKLPYFLSAMLLVASTILTCNSCSSTILVPSVPSTMMLDISSYSEREADKARGVYMRERVVSVRKDCELKKEVTTITTTDEDKKVIAIIHKGTSKEKVIIVGDEPEKLLDSRGTGIIIRSYDDVSYISTAEHVIEFFDGGELEKELDKIYDCKVYIQLDVDVGTDKNKIYVEIEAVDKDMDLAILKVEQNLKVSSEFISDPFPGETVWSSGYQRIRPDKSNIYISITKGTLATVYVSKGKLKVHRVTSQIFSGNSGGPVWNSEGKFVGTTLFMYGHREGDGSFTPYEGSYYIRPSSSIVILSLMNQKYSEIFRE